MTVDKLLSLSAYFLTCGKLGNKYPPSGWLGGLSHRKKDASPVLGYVLHARLRQVVSREQLLPRSLIIIINGGSRGGGGVELDTTWE